MIKRKTRAFFLDNWKHSHSIFSSLFILLVNSDFFFIENLDINMCIFIENQFKVNRSNWLTCFSDLNQLGSFYSIWIVPRVAKWTNFPKSSPACGNWLKIVLLKVQMTLMSTNCRFQSQRSTVFYMPQTCTCAMH